MLGDQHFDYVVCRRDRLAPPLAVELDDPRARRQTTTKVDVKATAARWDGFPVVRFAAGADLTQDAI